MVLPSWCTFVEINSNRFVFEESSVLNGFECAFLIHNHRMCHSMNRIQSARIKNLFFLPLRLLWLFCWWFWWNEWMEYKKNRNLYHHLHIYSRSFARAQTNKQTHKRTNAYTDSDDGCVCVCLSSLSTVIIGIVEEKCECERQAFAWYRKSNKQRVTQPDDASVG